MRRIWCGLALGVGLASVPALAHDGEDHANPDEAERHRMATDAAGAAVEFDPAELLPFPVQIDGRFDLIDQFGTPRSNEDFEGRATLIFFGYANCESICSVALPNMAEALDLVDLPTTVLQPIMITVDPANDTVDYLRQRMPDFHPDFLGLTGDEDALADAYAAFQVEAKALFETPEGQPVYAHGSFIYLIGPDGVLLSVFPPILQPERMAELIELYVLS